MNFADRIIAWQKAHGRHDLPWQRTHSPYHVWLSEVMLQQTQVATVIPYYERFVARFPDVRALAAAPVESVMASWAGLGYYSRARNLHRCAQQVVRRGGEFPSDVDALAQLPGIGRSTAGAIAALAFGRRTAILDGNVKRVLARHFGVHGFPGNASVARTLWETADSVLPAYEIEAYTQGMMDLGATVCTRNPKCGACPVSDTCSAWRQQMVNVLPTPRPAKQRPTRSAIVLAIRDAGGAVLLEHRPPTGIWGGLLSLPEFVSSASDDEVATQVQVRFGLTIKVEEALGEIRHDFTHYTYLMQPRVASSTGASALASTSLRAVSENELPSAPLPSPIRRLLLQLMQPALV